MCSAAATELDGISPSAAAPQATTVSTSSPAEPCLRELNAVKGREESIEYQFEIVAHEDEGVSEARARTLLGPKIIGNPIKNRSYSHIHVGHQTPPEQTHPTQTTETHTDTRRHVQTHASIPPHLNLSGIHFSIAPLEINCVSIKYEVIHPPLNHDCGADGHCSQPTWKTLHT